MGMSIEETNNILESYKHANTNSQLMLDKIHKMETALYSAQAGFIENEAGVRVSGGSHVSREQRIASLVDLKDQYARLYTQFETMCHNTLVLILGIYSTNPTVDRKDSKSLKLQKFENILIAYYIDDYTIRQIGIKTGYTERQTIRTLNAARSTFYEMYKDNDFEAMLNLIKGIVPKAETTTKEPN